MPKIEVDLEEFDVDDILEHLEAILKSKYHSSDIDQIMKFKNKSDGLQLPVIKTLMQKEKYELFMLNIEEISMEKLESICTKK